MFKFLSKYARDIFIKNPYAINHSKLGLKNIVRSRKLMNAGQYFG